ncbi:class I SAM-dependent methyltransferase [Polaromonas sp. SM01]|uniref:class I SAM-dependent methyltransferase n=1 Tax=Polaromonas sp. SM01 TaxID=3085630 RepID=UPI0029827D00|nr:class I SAM-dependent methyltransferase [Polaromonas sp. SM01]MDW5441697.1 class I SAM-dependent methyltransferase [Polaromonas sp. SM01]
MSAPVNIEWSEAGETRSARWRSESGALPPKRVVLADDTLSADVAYRLTSEGTALLWRGDFQNARHLVQALARRIDRPKKAKKAKPGLPEPSSADVFNLHRQAQSQRARTLAMVVLEFDGAHHSALRRAPNVVQACREVYGPGDLAQGPYVMSLRELLGLISAHEWRSKGVEIAALGGQRIHPHYGVFAPVRSEYLGLVADTALPPALATGSVAFDIGTGTGVLAAVLARRGVDRVVATDQDPRAMACARDNIKRLGLSAQINLLQADLFPEGRAPLIVCNPPWVPARPSSPIEHAVYDPDSRMLRGFLSGLAAHLIPGGEGWLILSDLAEHLGLRTRADLLAWVDAAGLQVLARVDAQPQHSKVFDVDDALHAARAAEVTSLWRLGAKAAA